MIIYWALFLVLAIGALLNDEAAARRTQLTFLLFASIPTILMIGLRWKIGPDWPGYLDIFTYTKLFTFSEALGHQDPGFMLLNWGLHQFNAPFWLLNFICGVIFISGLTAFCRRQPNPWLAYLVAFPYLVIVVGMSGDRQSAAIGFLFFALNAFEEERLYRSVVLVLAAAMFHGSILLILPICLLSYTRSGPQKSPLSWPSTISATYSASMRGAIPRKKSSPLGSHIGWR